MSGPFLHLAVLIAVSAVFASGCTTMSKTDSEGMADSSNEALVRAGFDRWRAGTGDPFELLAEHAHWTIVGSSPLSRTYRSKEQFMTEVIQPFNARMDQPLKPTIRNLSSDGDMVIVLFDAESRCVDGQPYRNTYASGSCK